MILDFFINSAQAIDKIPFTSSVGLGPLLAKMGCVSTNTDFLGCYINTLYTFFVQAAVILAVLMILVGGFQWLIAIGNQGKIGNAKSTISGAIVGLILALTAYLILAQINSGLIRFKPLDIYETNIDQIIKNDSKRYLRCVFRREIEDKRACENSSFHWCKWIEGECKNDYWYGDEAKAYYMDGNIVYDYYCCTQTTPAGGTFKYDVLAVPLKAKSRLYGPDDYCRVLDETNDVGDPSWKAVEFLICKSQFKLP